MNDERAELVAGLKALSVLHRIKPNECAMLRKAADYIESQPAGTPFAWTTLCAVTAEPVFSTSPPDEPNVAEWRPLYFHPSRVDAAAERDAFTGEDERECYSIGRAINRAATDLPEDWSIRIDLECGSGQVEIISPDGSGIDIDSGDLFSSQINEAIDAALAAQQQEKS